MEEPADSDRNTGVDPAPRTELEAARERLIVLTHNEVQQQLAAARDEATMLRRELSVARERLRAEQATTEARRRKAIASERSYDDALDACQRLRLKNETLQRQQQRRPSA